MGIEHTSEAWENYCLKFEIEYRGLNLERERPTRRESASSFCLVEALDQLWTKTPTFYLTRSALSSARATESTWFMVGAVVFHSSPQIPFSKGVPKSGAKTIGTHKSLAINPHLGSGQYQIERKWFW
jgi:hypothetical protein